MEDQLQVLINLINLATTKGAYNLAETQNAVIAITTLQKGIEKNTPVMKTEPVDNAKGRN